MCTNPDSDRLNLSDVDVLLRERVWCVGPAERRRQAADSENRTEAKFRDQHKTKFKKNDWESLILSSSLRGNERGPEMGGSKTIKVNGARSKKGLEKGQRTDEAQKGREGSDLKGGVCDIG